MQQVQVASPDGKVKLTVLPNAGRLTYTVTLGDTTIRRFLEPLDNGRAKGGGRFFTATRRGSFLLETFNSPLLTIAANPRSILTNAAVDVIKSVPAVWDETIVLPDSEIGGLAAYARRTGGTWFLAVMCGPQPREIKVPLPFLGGGQYKASFVRDAQNDDSVTVENTTSKRSDSLTIKLRAGGGFVGRFNQD